MINIKNFYNRDIVIKRKRFIRYKYESKIPAEKAYHTDVSKQHHYNDIILSASNLGILAGDGLLILDIDVKGDSKGLESLELFKRRFPILKDLKHNVVTPSGGLHIYIDIDLPLELKCKRNHPEYPDLEFFYGTGYNANVSCAGNKVPNGEYKLVDSNINIVRCDDELKNFFLEEVNKDYIVPLLYTADKVKEELNKLKLDNDLREKLYELNFFFWVKKLIHYTAFEKQKNIDFKMKSFKVLLSCVCYFLPKKLLDSRKVFNDIFEIFDILNKYFKDIKVHASIPHFKKFLDDFITNKRYIKYKSDFGFTKLIAISQIFDDNKYYVYHDSNNYRVFNCRSANGYAPFFAVSDFEKYVYVKSIAKHYDLTDLDFGALSFDKLASTRLSTIGYLKYTKNDGWKFKNATSTFKGKASTLNYKKATLYSNIEFNKMVNNVKLNFKESGIFEENGKKYLSKVDLNEIPLQRSIEFKKSGKTKFNIDAINNEAIVLYRLLESHYEMIFGKEQARILFDFAAFKIKNPTSQITWVPILNGFKGTGKTIYADMIRVLLGHKYTTKIQAEEIVGNFTSDFNDIVFCNIEEASFSTRIQGRTFYTKIKDLITSSEITVNIKHIKAYNIENQMAWVITTNDDDPLKYLDDKNDIRRFAFFRCILKADNYEWLENLEEKKECSYNDSKRYEFFKKYNDYFKQLVKQNTDKTKPEILRMYFNKLTSFFTKGGLCKEYSSEEIERREILQHYLAKRFEKRDLSKFSKTSIPASNIDIHQQVEYKDKYKIDEFNQYLEASNPLFRIFLTKDFIESKYIQHLKDYLLPKIRISIKDLLESLGFEYPSIIVYFNRVKYRIYVRKGKVITSKMVQAYFKKQFEFFKDCFHSSDYDFIKRIESTKSLEFIRTEILDGTFKFSQLNCLEPKLVKLLINDIGTDIEDEGDNDPPDDNNPNNDDDFYSSLGNYTKEEIEEMKEIERRETGDNYD